MELQQRWEGAPGKPLRLHSSVCVCGTGLDTAGGAKCLKESSASSTNTEPPPGSLKCDFLWGFGPLEREVATPRRSWEGKQDKRDGVRAVSAWWFPAARKPRGDSDPC